jgi:hypothetical protein
MGSREYVEAQRRLVALGPDGFLAEIAGKRFADVDEWQTQMQVKPMKLARVHLYTRGLSAADRALTGVHLVDSVEQAVAASVRASGGRGGPRGTLRLAGVRGLRRRRGSSSRVERPRHLGRRRDRMPGSPDRGTMVVRGWCWNRRDGPVNAFKSIVAVVVLAGCGACSGGAPPPPPLPAPSVSIVDIGIGTGSWGGLGVIAKGKNTSDRPLTVSISYALLDKDGVQLRSGALLMAGIGPQDLFTIEESISGAKDVQKVQITSIKAY